MTNMENKGILQILRENNGRIPERPISERLRETFVASKPLTLNLYLLFSSTCAVLGIYLCELAPTDEEMAHKFTKTQVDIWLKHSEARFTRYWFFLLIAVETVYQLWFHIKFQSACREGVEYWEKRDYFGWKCETVVFTIVYALGVCSYFESIAIVPIIFFCFNRCLHFCLVIQCKHSLEERRALLSPSERARRDPVLCDYTV